MPETNSYLQKLITTNPLRESVILKAIQALQLPLSSKGLDAGCGIGYQAIQLAKAVGPDGHITGLDMSPEFLEYANELAYKAGLSNQITFRNGNVNNLPFDDNTFDWAWSADCVGYAPIEPLPLIKELARVVKPGGIVAILAWSSQQMLPGYPQLEARLNATSSGIAPFVKGKSPESHFFRALGWFRDAGLENPKAETIAGNVHAPLSDDMRKALMAFIDMRWEGAQSEVSSEDWMKFQSLCQPDSPEFILNHPDYYAFFTYSMFYGWVAG